MGTTAKSVPSELLKRAFIICNGRAVELLGEQKSSDLLKQTYQELLPYFPYLERFSLDADSQLEIAVPELNDREVMAFAVWIGRYLQALRAFLVGIGTLDIRQLTKTLSAELEEISFYQYYQQAGDFNH